MTCGEQRKGATVRLRLIKMSRGKALFLQTDVTRALKAVRAAGDDVARVEIEQGKIVLVLERPLEDRSQTPPTTDTTNEWDSIQ